MVKRFATKVPLVPSRALTGGTASGCGTAGEGTNTVRDRVGDFGEDWIASPKS
jgi:hypothetical protein